MYDIIKSIKCIPIYVDKSLYRFYFWIEKKYVLLKKEDAYINRNHDELSDEICIHTSNHHRNIVDSISNNGSYAYLTEQLNDETAVDVY